MLKKSHLILLALISVGASGFDASQRRHSTVGGRPLADLAFDRWVEFKNTEGKFTILFPNAPKVGPDEDEETPGNLRMHYATYKSSIKYSVMYIDYLENLEEPIVAKDVIDRARDAGIAASNEAGEQPRLVSETDSTFEGHPARLLQISMAGGRMTWCKFVLVRNQFYFMEVVLPNPGRSGASKNYEKIAKFFINSFRLFREVA